MSSTVRQTMVQPTTESVVESSDGEGGEDALQYLVAPMPVWVGVAVA